MFELKILEYLHSRENQTTTMADIINAVSIKDVFPPVDVQSFLDVLRINRFITVSPSCDYSLSPLGFSRLYD